MCSLLPSTTLCQLLLLQQHGPLSGHGASDAPSDPPCPLALLLLLLLCRHPPSPHQVDPRHASMLSTRGRLPAASCRREVLGAVGGSDVVVISGATGCGKSTQVASWTSVQHETLDNVTEYHCFRVSLCPVCVSLCPICVSVI